MDSWCLLQLLGCCYFSSRIAMFKTEHSHVSPFYSINPQIIPWHSENKEVTWSYINSSFFHLKFPGVLLITPYFWRRKHMVHQNHRGAIGAVHVGPLWCLGPLGLLDLPFWWGLLCDQRLGRRWDGTWMPGLAGWCLVDFWAEETEMKRGSFGTSAPSFGEVFEDRNKHFQCLEKFGDLQTSEILDF